MNCGGWFAICGHGVGRVGTEQARVGLPILENTAQPCMVAIEAMHVSLPPWNSDISFC